MGKKKKRGGGGRKAKGKGRAPSKDHSAEDDQDLLSEELTALSAIFQEDFQILSQPPQAYFTINLKPHSDDAGDDNLNIVAVLSVRCLPGYPYKCPKLQIVPEKGLKQEDVEKLLSLLQDQANINAREGRVMIFNLVEAAQEFLSEVVPFQETHEAAAALASTGNEDVLLQKTSIICGEVDSFEGPFVYGLYDLFSDLCGDGGSWDPSVGTGMLAGEDSKLSREHIPVSHKWSRERVAVHEMDSFNIGQHGQLNSFLDSKPTDIDAAKNNIKQPISKLKILEEGTEDISQSPSSRDSNTSSFEESLDKDSEFVEDDEDLTVVGGSGSGDNNLDNQLSKSLSEQDEEFHAKKNDVFMAYLLRLACSANGSLASALSEITTELYTLGMLSERAKDMAAEPAVPFNNIFNHAFEQQMISSPIPQFWRANAGFGDDSASFLSSRYLNDFEEIRFIGHGGFGHVVLCKNKLDGRHYAIKKIRLKSKSSPFNDKILREVATLSRLQHHHVVRYYQAWFETQVGGYNQDNTFGSATAESSGSYLGTSKTSDISTQNRQESTYLYIQMEYCPRTLRQDFEMPRRFVDKEFVWHLFRQIVEGLAHIHGQGIIHRDLTPNNIFFDARNDIKIGDFGLAKFLKLEQLDQDHLPTETTGVSIDGTGHVGTYYYTAPEIEQAWPQINEKVDMYSLGVVFFELWHPFDTAMERHVVLSDLKVKGLLPPDWVTEFPEQSSLIQRLVSQNPSDRPSAKELLRHALPPRMEDEWLNDILRTIQTAEDTYVYDQVISTIFDEDRINLKAQRAQGDRSKMARDVSSFIQHGELDTDFRDIVIEVTKEVYRNHGARRLEISPLRLLDGYHQFSRRKAVRLLSTGGDMLELCHELRSPFLSWVITKQKLSFKRYEISWVHRKAIGHSTPYRFLQGDFDIVGGLPAVTVAETIKVALDVTGHFFHSGHFDIRLNHGQILAAIWSWVGIEGALRQAVADVLSSLSLYSPQSAERKGHWTFIRRQLLQGLNLGKSVVDRLQTVELRFCGLADQSLARLRGALPPDKHTRDAFEEISMLLNCLRVWRIEKNISIDVLMPPEENYYRGLFFQIYLNGNNFGLVSERNLFAIGGSYDQLLHAMWDRKSTAPSAVGVSLALEKILHHPSVDIRPSRHEPSTTVLVCSRGGGGLLEERMDIVAELWLANIKADFVPLPVCSLTMQYDYASEHDMKLLVVITEAGLSQTGLVEVRNLELKKEKKVERGQLIKFVTEAVSTQFRSLSIWN